MSEYKFEKEIIGSIHTAEDRYAIDKEDYEGFEKQREELSEVYRKAEAFDDLSALIAKRYEAEKDRAGYTADQYTQGVYYTLNNLNGVARDLERGDSE